MMIREVAGDRIVELLGDVDPFKVLLATSAENQNAGIAVTHDLFDSELLKMPIARVLGARAPSTGAFVMLYADLAERLQELGFRQLLHRVDVEDTAEIWALERSGFELMDVGIALAYRFDGPLTAPHYDDLTVEAATADDVKQLAPAMVLQPWGSRYEADPAYRPGDVRELRTRWLWNSFEHRADLFLVGKIDSHVAGYLAGMLDQATGAGVTDLVGTLPEFRRRRVASRILNHAAAWFSTRTDRLTVKTSAGNYAAANLYEKAGFTLCRSDLTFRLALNPAEEQ